MFINDVAKALNIQGRYSIHDFKIVTLGGFIMRKYILWIVALLLCATVVYGGSGISVGNVFNYEGAVRVGITNSNSRDIDNARVRMYIPELGIISPAITVNLDDDSPTSANLYAVEPVPEGEYLVKITVSKDGKRKTSYRYVYFE